MADEFNSYFLSVFTREDCSAVPATEPVFRGSSSEALHDIVGNEKSDTRKLMKLRSDKSPGVHNMSPRTVVEVQEELAVPIYILQRKSLDKGNVPEDWRLANVSPIYKKGSTNRAENYRPASLTSQV